MKTILCLLIVVAVCGIAHAEQLDSVLAMVGDKAKAEGNPIKNGKKEKSSEDNPMENIASTFENAAKDSMSNIEKFSNGFIGTIEGKGANGEKNKGGKAAAEKKEN